jgi:hypothetical protein
MLAERIDLTIVMRGLDPRIHPPTKKMDCRTSGRLRPSSRAMSGNDARG